MFKRGLLSLGIFVSAFSIAEIPQIDTATGQIKIGTMTAEEGINFSGDVTIFSDVWYIRGDHQRIDFGYTYESSALGMLNSEGFTPIDHPIYKITDIDVERVLNELDPDGEFADGCEYIGESDKGHLVKNSNHWCDPEFTLKRTKAYHGTEEIVPKPLDSVRHKLTNFNESMMSARYEVVEPGQAGFGEYTGYTDDKVFAFKQVQWVTRPDPTTINQVSKYHFSVPEGSELAFQYAEHYQPYPGYPRVKSSTLYRKVYFSIDLIPNDKNKWDVILTPDFWDETLPMCEEATQISSGLCQFGFKGTIKIDGLDSQSIATSIDLD